MVKAHFESLAASGTFLGRYRMANHQEKSTSFKLEREALTGLITDRGDGKSEEIRLLRVQPVRTDAVATSRTPAVFIRGTGFVVAPDLIATNYHVVEGGSAWEIAFPTTGTKLRLALVVADKANDLALLRVIDNPIQDLKPLAIVPSRGARLGEELYTVGFPLSGLLSGGHKVATGVLSATAGIEDDPRLFQITVPTQPGNSGGPIFNSRGEVVGVLASTLSVEFLYRATQHIPQNVNFAIKSDYLILLMNQSDSLRGASPTMGQTRADQIEMSQGSIGQITALK
jgi:serine protease Do